MYNLLLSPKGRPCSVSREPRGLREFNLELFDSYIQPDTESDCHIWSGSTNNAGYGLFGFYWITPAPGQRRGQMMSAHRAAWIIAHDQEIPAGMNVNHTCHNRLCVNPAHLEIGTQTEKIASMMRDQVRFGGGHPGRSWSSGPRYKKDANRNYKWNEAEITWFRNATSAEIAERLGYSLQRASSFRTRMRSAYKWLPWDGNRYSRGGQE